MYCFYNNYLICFYVVHSNYITWRKTTVTSTAVYDFLGRAVSVTTPLGITSNFYSGASDRLVRVSRTGQPDTLFVYDELGNVTATAMDVDDDGQVSYSGPALRLRRFLSPLPAIPRRGAPQQSPPRFRRNSLFAIVQCGCISRS